jgi:hypothetical protein
VIPLILATLFLTPADAVLRTAEIDAIDSYGDRVAWVETDGRLWTAGPRTNLRVVHTSPGDDVEEYRLVYRNRVLLRVAHGASGDRSLAHPLLSATKAYVTQRGGEFGGPWRLWRIDLRSGTREYAGLPGQTSDAVPLGAKRLVAYSCASERCKLILRSVTWRRSA